MNRTDPEKAKAAYDKAKPGERQFAWLRLYQARTQALKRELRMVPNLDGNGFVQLGRSSSDLTKDEMSGLLALIHAFGAQHGVLFNDERIAA